MSQNLMQQPSHSISSSVNENPQPWTTSAYGVPESVILALLGQGWSAKRWETELVKQGYKWSKGLKDLIIGKEYNYFKVEIGMMLAQPITNCGSSKSNTSTNVLPRLQGMTGEREQRLARRALFSPSASVRTLQHYVKQWREEDPSYGQCSDTEITMGISFIDDQPTRPNVHSTNAIPCSRLNSTTTDVQRSVHSFSQVLDNKDTTYEEVDQSPQYHQTKLALPPFHGSYGTQTASFQIQASERPITRFAQGDGSDSKQTITAEENPLFPVSNDERHILPYSHVRTECLNSVSNYGQNESRQVSSTGQSTDTTPMWNSFDDFGSNRPVPPGTYQTENNFDHDNRSNATSTNYHSFLDAIAPPSTDPTICNDSYWLPLSTDTSSGAASTFSQVTDPSGITYPINTPNFTGGVETSSGCDTDVGNFNDAEFPSFTSHQDHSLLSEPGRRHNDSELQIPSTISPRDFQILRNRARNASRHVDHLNQRIKDLRTQHKRELEQKDVVIGHANSQVQRLTRRLKEKGLMDNEFSEHGISDLREHDWHSPQVNCQDNHPYYHDKLLTINPAVLQLRRHDKTDKEAQLGEAKLLAPGFPVNVHQVPSLEEGHTSRHCQELMSLKATTLSTSTLKGLPQDRHDSRPNNGSGLPLRARHPSHEQSDGTFFSTMSKRPNGPMLRLRRKLSDKFISRQRDVDDLYGAVPPVL